MCCKIFSSTLPSGLSGRTFSGAKDLHGTQIVRIGHEEVLLAFRNQLVHDTRVVECIVQIAVTGWVPVLLVIISTLWAREEGLFVDAGVPGLIEGCDPDLLVSVFLNDAKGVLVSIE